MTASAELQLCFYGEHLDGVPVRSLGYRLLAPAVPESWSDEVEALARHLQAAPYPDYWPPSASFCSIVLGDDRRLVAVVRYALADHTPGKRRHGLELLGAVGPADLTVAQARTIAHWLGQRRAASDELDAFDGTAPLADVLATPTPQVPEAAVHALPFRPGPRGAWLLSATGPNDPDRHLCWLEQCAERHWQWLPLIGEDDWLADQAQRGPLFAWTPNLALVAVKADTPTERTAPPADPLLVRLATLSLLGILAVALLVVALPYLGIERGFGVVDKTAPTPAVATGPSADDLARSLHRLLRKQGSLPKVGPHRQALQYERLAAQDESLRVESSEGQALVVAVTMLARRNPERLEALVREALMNKGYDADLVNLACQRVREKLESDEVEAP
jgi:hypothetical protein